MQSVPNSWLDVFTKGCLFLTHIYPILIVVVIGYLFINRKLFGEVIVIIAFTLVFNRFLKSIFQAPLPPALGKSGWAFPSGHMQLAFAMWGWIAWRYRYKWFWIVLGIFLTGVGVGLVYQGYHYPRDIPAAVLFAGLSLVGFNYFFRSQWVKQHVGYSFIILIGIGLILMSFIPNGWKMPTPYLGLGVLTGAYLGWWMRLGAKISSLEEVSRNMRQRIFDLIGVALGVVLLFWAGFLIKGSVDEVVFQFFFGLLLTAWLTGGGLLLGYFLQAKCFRKSCI